jgi:hypothetical protein
MNSNDILIEIHALEEELLENQVCLIKRLKWK